MVTAAQVTIAQARPQGGAASERAWPGPRPPFPAPPLMFQTSKGEVGSGKTKTSQDVHTEMTNLLCPFGSSGPQGAQEQVG